MQKIILAFVVLGLWIAPSYVQAERLGVKGYDLIWYQKGKPMKGNQQYSAVYQGVTYLFTSKIHKTTFQSNPEKYLPAYGGYCAYGIARGGRYDIDPLAWTVVKGKLYLNYNKSIHRKWGKDIPGYIKKADSNWPALKGINASGF